MPHSSLNLAIVGATGAVGTELIACVAASRLPVGRVRAFASSRSAGQRLRGTAD
jgi:aspartate-semialdehyde dehydrogenase